MKHNEEDTSDIVRDFYTPQRFPGLTKANQEWIEGASKTEDSTRPGKPEFIFRHDSYSDFALLVEAKDTLDKHQKAENQAVHYCQKFEEQYPNMNTVALAISGNKEDYKVTLTVPNIYSDKVIIFDHLVDFEDIVSILYRNEGQEQKELKEVIEYAHYLNKYLKEKLSVEQQQRPLMVAAIMIALSDVSFRSMYRGSEKADADVVPSLRRKQKKLMNHLWQAINDSLDIALPNGSREISTVKGVLSFIKSNTRLYEKNEELPNNPTHLFHIIRGLETHLFSGAHVSTDLDLIGKFFQEFIPYRSGGDGSELGIVLTPGHITDLMCDLMDINIDSDVYDPCTGTGGFLVTAMSKMLEMADAQIGNKKELEKKKNQIKKEQIYGTELNAKMYTMAIANLIFKGDGHPDILHGDCFKLEKQTKQRTPNAGILNPPYSQPDLPELKFINHTLDMISRNGKVVAVVPKSTGTDQSKSNLINKGKLLKNHTLETVISLPDDVFAGVGTSTIILVFKAGIPHQVSKVKTMFINFEDDGFKTGKNGVRFEKNYEERKKWLFDVIDSKSNIPCQCAHVMVDFQDEWGVEINTFSVDYNSITDSDFINVIKERNVNEYKDK